MKAIFMSVLIKKSQCAKTSDAQTCDDAAALAQKGLAAPKPAGTSDADWKKLTGATYPVFHSAIALDDASPRRISRRGSTNTRTELMLYHAMHQTQGPGCGYAATGRSVYAMPGSGKDLVKAVWFYARAWNFAPAGFKAQIEPKLEYYYKKYHGNLDGLDAHQDAGAATIFPPGNSGDHACPTPG